MLRRYGHRTFFIFLALMFVVPSALAQCYTPSQAEAEQGIRIHSELMVIGLNCQHMGKREGDEPLRNLQAVHARYADLFAGYEATLLSFFTKRGDSNPEASLNALRTGFANKISKDAAGMRPDVFCAQYAPRIDAVAGMQRAICVTGLQQFFLHILFLIRCAMVKGI